MPILIMKEDARGVGYSWPRPHAIWNGTKKDAESWCDKKNKHPNNISVYYSLFTVKNEYGN